MSRRRQHLSGVGKSEEDLHFVLCSTSQRRLHSIFDRLFQ